MLMLPFNIAIFHIAMFNERRVLIIDYYDGVKGCDPYLHKGMSIPR